MGQRYAITSAQNAAASPGKVIADMEGATTTRGRIYDVMMGSDATPADNAFRWQAPRRTADGTTATAITGRAIDPADGAALITPQTWSTDPSATANSQLLDIPLNMRATFRWVAAPGGELVIPATASAAIMFTCQHASATSQQVLTVHWDE